MDRRSSFILSPPQLLGHSGGHAGLRDDAGHRLILLQYHKVGEAAGDELFEARHQSGPDPAGLTVDQFMRTGIITVKENRGINECVSRMPEDGQKEFIHPVTPTTARP